MPRSRLFEKVKAAVTDGISRGEYDVGNVLPPADELASRIRCSAGTVRRALTELAAEGVVQRVRHRGTVVARRPNAGHVCLMISSDAHTNLLLQDVIYARLVKAGYHVDMVPRSVDIDHALSQCERLLQGAKPSDCMVALEPFPDVEPEASRVWEMLRRFERKVVFGRYPASVPPDIPVVAIDQQVSARIVVEHLLALGHRNVSVIAGMHPEEASWTQEQATHCRHFLEMAGATYVPHFLADAGIEGVLRLFKERQATAYFGVTDDEVVHLAGLCAAAGLRVGQDISLIGRNDTPWAVNSTPPLTSVSLNPPGIAEAIVEALDLQGERKREVEGRIIRRVAPQLVVRESTGSAPKSRSRKSKQA